MQVKGFIYLSLLVLANFYLAFIIKKIILFFHLQVSVIGLTDLSGHVLEFAQDQHGSRFIQQKLEMASKDEKDKIFDEISPSALSLMTDVFGNYVIQKFVEFGTEEHQRKILMIVLPTSKARGTLQTRVRGVRFLG